MDRKTSKKRGSAGSAARFNDSFLEQIIAKIFWKQRSHTNIIFASFKRIFGKFCSASYTHRITWFMLFVEVNNLQRKFFNHPCAIALNLFLFGKLNGNLFKLQSYSNIQL